MAWNWRRCTVLGWAPPVRLACSALLGIAAMQAALAQPAELTLDSVLPPSGSYLGGTPIELSGSFALQFNTGALSASYEVFFTASATASPEEDLPATVTAGSVSRVTAITPAVNAPGLYNVYVRAADGSTAGVSNLRPFAMEDTGESDVEAAARTLEDNFEFADTDGDGGLSYEEALILLPHLERETFNSMDLNNDGILTPLELDVILRGEVRRHVLTQFSQLDRNGDGVLSRAEFFAVTLLTEADWLWADLNRDDFVTRLEAIHLLEEGYLLCTDSLAEAAVILLGDFALFDANADGSITVQEAQQYSCPELPASVLSVLAHISNGRISPRELLGVAASWLFSGVETPQESYDFEAAAGALPGTHYLGFRRLDTNRDGRLSTEEMGGHIAGLLWANFGRIDANSNGVLTLPEVALFLPYARQRTLDTLDTDGDGALSRAELEAWINEEPVPPRPRGCQCPKEDYIFDLHRFLADYLLAGVVLLLLQAGWRRTR